MTHRTVVLNVVGLTPDLVGAATPRLTRWAQQGKIAAIQSITPAVTCSVQATYLTGVYPNQHGIVGNGWYFHDECEIKFWRQSNKLIQAPKVWEVARSVDTTFTCANLFWWYNMYSTADYTITPRPMYPADGRKLPDIYTKPTTLRTDLQRRLGTFPLFDFWGPKTSIRSSQWIAAAAKIIEQRFHPTLTLIYLPHLDYNLQRLGPHDPAIRIDLQQIDAVCGDLIDFYTKQGTQVIVLSEYGITDVNTAIHLNRRLREQGLLAVREELGRELLDAGASAAFAVADHQVAHIYINDPRALGQVRQVLEQTPGIEQILDEAGKRTLHMDHPRAGDLIAIAQPHAWFTYYYWFDDRRAPDFARTVDIHRKPGYDPAELFLDPALRFPQLKIAWTLLKKQLGARYLLAVIPVTGALVKGSHGRVTDTIESGPLFMTQRSDLLTSGVIDATDVFQLILRHCGLEVLFHDKALGRA